MILILTIGREVQLSTDDRGILVVPIFTAHNAKTAINAHFDSSTCKLVFDEIRVLKASLYVVVLITVTNTQSYAAFSTSCYKCIQI